ncbi:hypothetical protein D9M68_486160 [compost metagenome]
MGLTQADRLDLSVVVQQNLVGDLLGHRLEQLVALLVGHIALGHHPVEQDLDIDLVVGAVDAAGIVDKVGVHRATDRGELAATQLGGAQVAALGEDRAAQLAAIHPDAVVVLVADLGVALSGRLDVGTDAAVPDHVDLRLEQGVDQVVRRQAVGCDAEALLHLRTDGDALGGTREDATARGNQRVVVIRPGRPRQIEQALALGVAGGDVGCRIDKDMAVVERGDQLNDRRQQHAVAEYVSGHITDADHAEWLRLGIQALLAEVALDRLPGAACGNAHLLVVIALAAAGRKGVAQPESVLLGDAVGDIGEGRGALVRGDHQVGIVLVMAHHLLRGNQIAFDNVVGDVEQAANKGLVAGDALIEDLVALVALRRALDDETAFGADRHDHRVLHLLRLDQPQHLGTEVLEAVRPAQAAASDLAEAQVDAFYARGVDEHFELRARLGDVADQARAQLEGEIVLELAFGIALEEVGPHGRADQLGQRAQDAVLAEAVDLLQGADDLVLNPLGGPLAVESEPLLRRETRLEQGHQQFGDPWVFDQGAGNIWLAVALAQLAHVARVGAEQGHLAAAQAGAQHQTVELVVFRGAGQHLGEGVLKCRLDHLHVDRLRVDQGVVVDPADAAVLVADLVGVFAVDLDAQVFQNRHHVREHQRTAVTEQLEAQDVIVLLGDAIEAH